MVYTESMAEQPATYQLENFHFPRQLALIKRLRGISFFINDVTLFASFITILLWAINMLWVHALPFNDFVYPTTALLFILSGIPLLFGAKRHLLQTHHDATEEKRPWWEFGVPIMCAVLTALLGLVSISGSINPGFRLSSVVGVSFLLIGLSLLPPFTRIPHRFHVTQFLVFLVSGIHVFVILEHIYQYFSRLPVQHVLDVSLLSACAFIFFCSGILLRWTNRGFLGNFTLDSTASIFALRIFLLNLISAPLIALLILLSLQNTQYNLYVVLTVIIVSIAIISSFLLWINVRILYGHELEHVLMRETLRSHNINLATEQEKLQKRMEELEKDKQLYRDKLSSQQAWQDAADSLG